MTDETYMSAVREWVVSINVRNLLVAVVLAFIPAVVLAIELFVAFRDGSAWMFWAPWAGFTFLLYRQRPLRNKGAAVLFYLAVEAFILPVVMLVSTYVFTSQQEAGLSQLGAAIGGGFLVVVTAVVGFAVGVVLYLISNRLEIEKVEAVKIEGR